LLKIIDKLVKMVKMGEIGWHVQVPACFIWRRSEKQGLFYVCPLSLAEQRGHKEIVELLRKHGAKE